MNSLENLSVQIFADGADLDGIAHLNRDPLIKGLTTNPTLMRKAGISDYEQFAKQVLQVVKEKPISFEVFKAAKLVGVDLGALSLDTVKMFAKDAELAGFTL